MVLQVQEENPGVGQGEPVAFPVGLHQVVLGHPVAFPSQLERVPFDPFEAVLPHSQNLVLLGRRVTPFREPDCPVQELPLDVQRTEFTSAGQPYRPTTREIIADLTDGPDRVFQSHVPEHHARFLQHSEQQSARSNLQEPRVLAHVGVTDDHVQTSVPLGVSVGLVTRVDDGT